MQLLSRFLDRLSEFFAARKGLLPIVGLLLIALNFVVQFLPMMGFVATSDLFLHLGIVIAILGFLLAWAL
ncbi:MAG: hypothetical protein DWQ07_01950 [Chloroflexi bacterium]|nr:MAG: hypothetical protein DWQ07_01950 [Chloroflexota bacterium]MBL1193738.1 hypothetical protein [Chloroflexota bacterium]NOH11031.1 hypothetical protein [Chloroflexota bacterium]